MTKSLGNSSLPPAASSALDTRRPYEKSRFPLHAAVLAEPIHVVSSLLSGYEMINQRCNLGYTPLHYAVIEERIDVVGLILATQEADVTSQDMAGNTALHIAALKNEPAIAHLLLQDPYIDVNQENDIGDTPLTLAFKHNNTTVALQLLSDVEIDLNAVDSQGNTPLIWAVINRNIPLILTLMEKRALRSNIPDRYGNTPLNVAVKNNDLEITQILLQYGFIDVNYPDSNGYSPFFNAVLSGNSNISLSILQSEDVLVRQVGQRGETPLHVALNTGLIVVAEALLRHPGININYKEMWGNSAFFLAVYSENIPLVRMILDRYPHVNISSMNNMGITPLIRAQNVRNQPIVELLSEKLHKRLTLNNKKQILQVVREGNCHSLEKLLSYKIPHRHILNAIKIAQREKNARVLRRLISYNAEEQILSKRRCLTKLSDSPSRYPLLDNMVRLSISRGVSGKRKIVLMTQPKSDHNYSFDLIKEVNFRLFISSIHDYVIVPHDVGSINGALDRYRDKIAVIVLRAHGDRYRAGCDEGFNISTIRNIHFEKAKGVQIVLDSCETGLRLARQVSTLTGLEVFAPRRCHQQIRLSVDAEQRISNVHFLDKGQPVESERIHLERSNLGLFTGVGMMYLKPANL